MSISIGDYVFYTNNKSNTPQKYVAIVNSLQDQRVRVLILSENKNIECSVQDLSFIETNEKHLLAIGFYKITNPKGFKYILDDIVVSGLHVIGATFNFSSGLCIGDFEGVSIETYFQVLNGFKISQLNSKAFYSDFPNISYNINTLFRELDRKQIVYDKTSVIHIE